MAKILSQRGFSNMEEVRAYLHPDLGMLPAPEEMKGMNEAVALVHAACVEKKVIYIHGDYDVDGITSTSLLTQFFREIGLDVYYYIPNRLTEGYSLSYESIDNLLRCCKNKKGLIVTVDCGISSIEEVRYAKKLGMDIIITDHHLPPEKLPAADAVINPKQVGCSFPFEMLSGVGVAFYLALGIRNIFARKGVWQDTPPPNMKKYLDLVALGTVADVMPLTGANRVLVRAGLEVLTAKNRPGIFALCDVCRLSDQKIQPEDISFKLAPRINATGRLGCPLQGVELLLAEDVNVARKTADNLEQLNITRKEIESAVLPEVYTACDAQVERGAKALVVYNNECHQGVLGIVASRVVDKYLRPAIIFSDTRDKKGTVTIKGSGRSVDGVNLYKTLGYCAEFIEQFGGHAMAVGLTVSPENLSKFTDSLNDQIAAKCRPGDDHQLTIDYFSPNKNIFAPSFVQALQLMQPFGEGNPEPLFLLKNEKLLNLKEVKGHVMFNLQRKKGGHLRGVGFGLAEHLQNLKNPKVDLILKLKRSSFRGRERDEVQAVHISQRADI